jgi:hypothetical protein
LRYHDVPNSRFIVEYQAVQHYPSGNPETFQVMLFGNGTIVYQYHTVSRAASATVGIENGAGTEGLQVAHDASVLRSGLAVRIARAPDEWWSVSPLSGTVAPGQNLDVTVGFNTASLTEGTYDAVIDVITNDPDQPQLSVPVTLVVGSVADPDITISPETLTAAVSPGGRASATLTLGNVGGGAVTFQATGQVAPVATVMPAGSGGPDAFRYVWTDSDEPGGPVYQWVEISSLGTQIVLGDDAFQEVGLPFAFPFYGEAKTTVKVSSNGFLTFGTDGVARSNASIPSSTQPNDLVAPFWDDLNPRSGSEARIYGYYDAANSRFIVEYQRLQHYPSGNPETFEVMLYADGTIVYQYQTVSRATTATVGIENRTGTDGLQVSHNASSVHGGLAVQFRLGTNWLSVTPQTGTVAAGGNVSVSVGFDASGLAAGTYEGEIVLESNDRDEPRIVVPVVLRVGS